MHGKQQQIDGDLMIIFKGGRHLCVWGWEQKYTGLVVMQTKVPMVSGVEHHRKMNIIDMGICGSPRYKFKIISSMKIVFSVFMHWAIVYVVLDC